MKIVILNTGCSNISSVKWAIYHIGYKVKITSDLKIIKKADKILLPGIGTPKSVMKQLRKRNIIDFLINCNKPILGICLGMQLFGKYSEENSNIKTLNIINQPVKKLNNNDLILPHIGWNKVIYNIKNTLFHKIPNNSYFYFVHSYAMSINKYTVANCYYGEFFSAVIQRKNFFGVQFHPEKSGKNGFQLLKNFLEI